MEKLIFLEPRSVFDPMIIGVCSSIDGYAISYDKDKILEHLQKEVLSGEGETSADDAYVMAVEYFDFNILGSYMGENTPVYVSKADFEVLELEP